MYQQFLSRKQTEIPALYRALDLLDTDWGGGNFLRNFQHTLDITELHHTTFAQNRKSPRNDIDRIITGNSKSRHHCLGTIKNGH